MRDVSNPVLTQFFNQLDPMLQERIRAQSFNMTTLDLTWNALGSMSGNDLAQALSDIPRNVTTLNLSSNKLGIFITKEIPNPRK